MKPHDSKRRKTWLRGSCLFHDVWIIAHTVREQVQDQMLASPLSSTGFPSILALLLHIRDSFNFYFFCFVGFYVVFISETYIFLCNFEIDAALLSFIIINPLLIFLFKPFLITAIRFAPPNICSYIYIYIYRYVANQNQSKYCYQVYMMAKIG